MKIYVLGYTYEYEGSGVITVFISKTKAEKAIALLKEHGFRKFAEYWLQEFDSNDQKAITNELERDYSPIVEEVVKKE